VRLCWSATSMLGRGASADQDARFGNKMKKLKSTMHFGNALSTKVRPSRTSQLGRTLALPDGRLIIVVDVFAAGSRRWT
jgi:hypothetical protein